MKRCSNCDALLKPRVLGAIITIPHELPRSKAVEEYVDEEHADLARLYKSDVLYVCSECTFAIKARYMDEA